MDLEDLKKKIKEYAIERGLKVIEGISGIKENFVLEEYDYKKFLDLAKELNCHFVLVNKGGEIDEDYVSVEEDLSGFPEIEKEILSLKNEFKENFGKMGILSLCFLKENHSFCLNIYSEWFQELDGKMDKINESLQEKKRAFCSGCGKEMQFISRFDGDDEKEILCFECRKKKHEGDDKILDELSDKLSKDQDFLKLKNRSLRKIYVEKKYPEIELSKIYGLTERAKAKSDLNKI